MSIKQLNAKYFLHEDRILLRMNTLDQSEYKFWLTRRVTLFISNSASKLFEKDHAEKVQKEKVQNDNAFKEKKPEDKPEESVTDVENVASAKRMINELQETGKQAQFGGAFEPGVQYPIGADPILVMDAKCNVMKNGEHDFFSLDLILPGGANVNLKLTIPIMKNVILLLEEASTQAGW